MTGDYDERFRQHEDILRGLTTMLARQDVINERLTASIERIDFAIERLDRSIEELKAINAGTQTTLARIETLLDRLLHPGGNGREP